MALRKTVLVGVDDIPSRWQAQRTAPDWIGVGGTDLFTVQVSEHRRGTACAGCLHPVARPDSGPIPTVAFVSFWSGLLLAVRLLRLANEDAIAARDQQRLFTTLRPESWGYTAYPVVPAVACPVGCAAAKVLPRGYADIAA